MRACVVNDRDKLNNILKTRRDRKVPVRQPDGCKTPLHYAVLEGSTETVRAVLANQRNINLNQRESEHGRTALALACSIVGIPTDIIVDILEARPRLAVVTDANNKTPIDLLWQQGRYVLILVRKLHFLFFRKN